VVDLHDPRCTLHREAVPAFLDMRRAATKEGIDLVPVSSFRDFAAQAAIWNEKFGGRRALFDRAGIELDAAKLSPEQIVDAILCWSAVPGASRHHWGTEVDVIDRAAVEPGARVRLLPEEYVSGPFARLDRWLTDNQGRFRFFRPYATDRGGVAPEPWHLSYAPVSVPALGDLSETVLREALAASELSGKDIVMARLAQIHERYVASVDSPPPATVA
jgi:LAS superfamily LD-carboxypeptidase LdcB